MYQLEMSLSVVGNAGEPTTGPTIYRLTTLPSTLSDIARMLTCVSQELLDYALPKDSQPGKPLEGPAPSISGVATLCRLAPEDCPTCQANLEEGGLWMEKDGHVSRKFSGLST
jgi:hypothetical protein